VLDRKIRYCSLPEAVRDHFLWGARSIVITGTHGKTTTTSLAGWLLTHGGADPSVFIGGIAENFESSYRIGGGREFVIEGDEYDSAFFDKTAKFLKYLPDIAVVNNIEFDHADIYPSLDAIRLAFQRLVDLVPRRGLLLLGADNADALALRERARCRVETFGLSDGADWQAHDLKVAESSTTFSVRRGGQPAGSFEVGLLGAYNVRNAIAETIAGVRSAYPERRIWAVFEPRSATSCRRVFQADFAKSFGGADEVVVASVFRSTLPEDERLSAEELVVDLRRRGQSARYIPEVDDIIGTLVQEHRKGDLVVLMSNGGFGGIHQKLLKALAA
jgi:UDP-N-acetylmuramate: L-alanyl-gamma-D-glutamyl-meso-diaminopimelate ligase